MLNIIYPVYNPKPETLKRHLDNWKSYPEELKSQVRIVIVDDGSKEPVKLDIPLPHIIARIEEDIYWNVCGAQNLGHYLIDRNEWSFSTDIDHILYPQECEKILRLKKETGNVYWFVRIKEGKIYKQHQNTFLIHCSDFFKIGGYDEDLAGNSGYNDALLIAKMKYYGLSFVNTDIKVNLYENMGINCNGYVKQGLDKNLMKYQIKVMEMVNHKYQPGNILRFRWRITL